MWVVFQTPDSAYFDTDNLRVYLEGNSNAYFVDKSLIKMGFSPEKRDDLYLFLSELGVSFTLKIKNKEIRRDDKFFKTYELKPNSLRTLDKGSQSVLEKIIDGFDLFCKEINLERSVALWSLLINKMQQQGAYFFRLSLEGEYKYIEKYKQDFTIETFYNTIAYNQLFTQKWIYNKKGELSTIKDIKNSEDLNDKYDFSLPDLFFFFGS